MLAYKICFKILTDFDTWEIYSRGWKSRLILTIATSSKTFTIPDQETQRLSGDLKVSKNFEHQNEV